ncbi:MAG: CHAT domain-containing protein, partial [Bacteroidetes bacterium]|nr:CHAT domain-containing protein [Bacteroidota bacterium]
DLPSLQPTIDDNWFASLIRIKAGYYYKKFETSKNRDDLIQAYQHYKYALKFNMYIISRATNEEESSFRNHMYSLNAYQNLLEIAYKLYEVTSEQNYVKDVYGLLAKSKYAYLNRNDFSPVLSSEINRSVLLEELKLVKRNILAKIPSITDSQLNQVLPSIPNDAGNTNLARLNLSNQISDTLSMQDIQNQLAKEKATLLDYYLNRNDLYIIKMSSQEFSVAKRKLPDDFIQLIWRAKKINSSTKVKEYVQNSNRLYREILDSVLNLIPKKTRHLIICPDFLLQNISWDALVTDTLNFSNYKELNYLIKDYTIRTVLSPGHWLRPKTNLPGYYGIASNYAGSKHFSDIPFSYALVKRKSKEHNGNFASLVDKNDSINAGVLHLATHVKNDSLRPYNSSVYFGDHDSITINTLLHSKLKAGLVILNGCETGNGTYYQSGTISMARAFYQNGASSVVMTLWSVDDKTSSEVLSNFYDEIEVGNTLDVSLRNAKLKFIANAPTDELANPYYWGGLQLSGRNDPAYKNDFYKSVMAWLMGFVVLGIIFNSIRRNKLAKSL